MVRYGYACINMHLQEQGFSVNRTMRKASFEREGLGSVSNKVIDNLKSLVKTISWNKNNGIQVYRMSSSMFPWMSHYEIEDLPNISIIKNLLVGAGKIAIDCNQRLSFHPGQFTVLSSPNQKVVDASIKELNQHAQIMDIMELDKSHQYPINIHLGGTYDSKIKSIDRFCHNFEKLSDSAKARLVIENDDKESMYSVKDLLIVNSRINTPITFDYHHHKLHSDNISEEGALILALLTWKKKPIVHYSSSKRIHEDSTSKPQAHADYIYERIENYGNSFDCEIEAKAKEKAVLKYIKDYES